MGIEQDKQRFKEIGEKYREDLKKFIQQGQIGAQLPHKTIKIPIRQIQLPEFDYKQTDTGGVAQMPDQDQQQGQQGQQGQGQGPPKPQPGMPAGQPQRKDGQGQGQGDGEGGDQAGQGSGEHGYYEMDPEEFAKQLDEELGLDLEPKGKSISEEKEGNWTELARQGTESNLEKQILLKEGLKRKLATDVDEQYLEEALKVEQVEDEGVKTAFQWLATNRSDMPISIGMLENIYEQIADEEKGKYASFEQMDEETEYTPAHLRLHGDGAIDIQFREEDKRYKHPEVVTEPEKNVVVVNIRDISGSMHDRKKDLVERVFTPLDWYLKGKYDNAEFVYIVHDSEAWEVEDQEFFGIDSMGGTKISSAYELAKEILDEEYPWSDWNRYVFAAGDGENWSGDTQEAVIPLMEEIDANLHAYVETQPDGGSNWATHADEVNRYFQDEDNVEVVRVRSKGQVMDAIYNVLKAAGGGGESDGES